jgi:hypothetical protein
MPSSDIVSDSSKFIQHSRIFLIFFKARIYKGVIEDVIRNVRNDFVNMGVDEQVLYDLQQVKMALSFCANSKFRVALGTKIDGLQSNHTG